MTPPLYRLRIDCLACLVLQAWVASQFSGFKVQLGDILSSQLADALATERTKTDTDIAQVGNTCVVLSFTSGFPSRRLHIKKASHQCQLRCTPTATEYADVGAWSLSCSASL